MAVFVKRLLHAINILTAVYVFFALLFSTYSVRSTYKNLSEVNYSIEKEYNAALDNYKKVIVFILKNRLPENINYFNSVANITYKLPLIKEFKIGEAKDIIIRSGNEKLNSNNISHLMACHNDRCIKVFVDTREVLDKISKGKLWGHGEIPNLPIKKITLLKISIHSFLEEHKDSVVITLVYLFVLYLFQALLLFIKNFRLTKNHTSLLTESDKNKRELTKQSTEYDKLCESILFTQELVSEYFTHYVHQLITRDVCIKDIDLIDVLRRIDKFFNYQVTKKSLKVVLDCENAAKTIKSDEEIIFVILLNLIFKAIVRSKMSSEVFIKVFAAQHAISIEISDAGYEYNPELGNKIQIWELPDPVLEKLYEKVEIEVKETRKSEANVVFVKISRIEKINKVNDNVIKLKLYGKKNQL